MARYFLEIAYEGANYSGWQIQPNAQTVQNTLDTALSALLSESIRSVGCGRTDSGVHASQFFLHFDTLSAPPSELVYRLNKMLPNDISVFRLIPVADNAHARYDATYRAYNYFIHFDKNPFLRYHSFFFPWTPLDMQSMQTALEMLAHFNDFKAFEKKNDAKTSLCNIFKTALIYDEIQGRMQIHIAANRFLRGMVRRIVGTLLWVGKGKISLLEFENALAKGKSFKITITAPPQALSLCEVRYSYI
ncbi:MAG: tRNA pseudouridine(38-40) synthase TruA [Chitinophagales bacterium]|nr:tRNA pseudouridine(38-40) synthase TruA [Bacteroidota bacterium]MCB9042425.1 tRNA pseudouridine(38-40) synthase TruA [Chitinophagales bacterium]